MAGRLTLADLFARHLAVAALLDDRRFREALRAMKPTIAQTRPPDLGTALIRTVCYAWATTARFHNPVAACHFCGQMEAEQSSGISGSA